MKPMDYKFSVISYQLLREDLNIAIVYYMVCQENFFKTACTSVMNTVARLVIESREFYHKSPVLQYLHWLPTESRSKFKMSLLGYKWVATDIFENDWL